MANYLVGDMIRETRERRGYSQEELCYGICAPSTLSRIETGVQIPGRRILESLTQRLGITDSIYNTYAGREELELYEHGKELMRCLGRKEFEKVQELISQMEHEIESISRADYNGNAERQYLIFAKALLKKNQGQNRQEVLELLLESIRVTLPEFDGIHIRNRLLTFHEISILNNIGCIYHEIGNVIDAFHIMFYLKEYLETHVIDDEEKAKKYPMILQNISTWLALEHRYEDALKLCEQGVECCISYGKLNVFPLLLYNKASLLAELGQLDVSRECFIQTITIFHAIHQHERAENVRSYANRGYRMNL